MFLHLKKKEIKTLLSYKTQLNDSFGLANELQNNKKDLQMAKVKNTTMKDVRL